MALYTRAVKDETEGLRLYLKNFVTASAQSIRGDDVLTVPLDESCQYHPAFQKLTLELKKIAKIDPRIDDAYLLLPTGKENILQFVTNANKEVSPVACGEEGVMSHDGHRRDPDAGPPRGVPGRLQNPPGATRKTHVADGTASGRKP